MNLKILEYALKIIRTECLCTSCSDCVFRDGCDEVLDSQALSSVCNNLIEQIDYIRESEKQ